MVTITAPGVEINELDLSFYDFPAPKEETLNVLINGFSVKGHTNSPYKFTSKNSDADLINTFGTPTNEAERYFFNACSEAIKRDKVVLYATRLPYDNESTNNYNYAEYKIESSNVSTLTSNTDLSAVISALSNVTDIILAADKTLSNKYIAEIKSDDTATLSCTSNDLEQYRTGVKKPTNNHFIIVDKNQEIYEKIPVDANHTTLSSRYLLGVMPVVTTATNAMYYQKLIGGNLSAALSNFEPLSAIKSRGSKSYLSADDMVYVAHSELLPVGNKDALTLSKYAMGFFPTVNIAPDGSFDRDRLKNIGVVVFKGRVDAEAGNKINYEPIEAFAGSLKSDDVDPTTGESRFIDDIINTNSQTIEFYSNCFNSDINSNTSDTENNELFETNTGDTGNNELSETNTSEDGKQLDIGLMGATKTSKITKKTITPVKSTLFGTSSNNTYSYDDIAILHINHQTAQILGFTELAAADKKISVNKIYSSLDKVFEKNKSRDEMQIDLVVDTGVANIALFMETVNKQDPWLSCYDPIAYSTDTKNAAILWDICTRVGSGSTSVPKDGATAVWKIIMQKYDAFCKLRGDCMFIADGLRPLCICGNRKRVTKTNFNSSVVKTINPFMKYITGLIDTSYGCGNCDWYQIIDPTSGTKMWMPPSVKMMCSMLDTTNAKFYWTVPVGVNNGKMNPIDNPSKVKVIDIAFSPTTADAGDIYTKSWNYAKYYEDDGFVLEGQRTFQTRPTAFDRINVRRLFLYLERKVYNAAKYFIYEGNTAYTRQRLIDTIKPFFDDAKINEGLYDYRIQCDDKNNTPDTIDRNELHVKIAIKPTKAIEFIECTFVALRTGASFTEAGMND